MDWMNQLGGLLQRYAGAGADQAPPTVHDDFDQFTQAAPRSALADGIAAAFRSDQTPPFAQMVGQLFSQSDSHQRAGLLNTLIGAAGPGLLSQVLGGGGASGLAGLLGSGRTQFTPEEADQVPPDVVQQLAAHAEQRDPSVLDMIGNFYAEHPDLVKGLGGGALAVALSRLAGR